MKTIGIIGGLGPMATIYYMELLTKLTKAVSDQQHPRIIMESMPDTPDRTAYILGESTENPFPMILQAAKDLQKMGAEIISLPCITGHFFYDDLCKQLEVPVINMPMVTARQLHEAKIKRVGIMATTGTLKSNVLSKPIQDYGISVVVPDTEKQKKVMSIIYDQIKRDDPIDWAMVSEVVNDLLSQGAEQIILGCTELPLLKREIEQDIAVGRASNTFRDVLLTKCVDILDVLAREVLKEADVPIKGGCQMNSC